MIKQLQTLPIGDSSFESINQNNCLYVDKTKHIYQMLEKGKYYFLSRPRRFGKSLTVSTLRCLFQGKKELFDGLWIVKNINWEWKKYPVITLDFNGITHDTPHNLKLSLKNNLKKIAQKFDTNLSETFLKEQFKELILSLNKKSKAQVVILVDEYDKPIIDYLGKGGKGLEIAKANREILKNFFGVIKDIDVLRVLRFVFITGVSKFSRVSIFSELNNLDDITMNRHYADMLGYTQEELENFFADHISIFAKELNQSTDQVINRLKLEYNGYRFSEKNVSVYNPFSVLKALNEMAYKKFWFETGTPKFLINLLRETNWDIPAIESMQATESVFSVYEIENLQPEALLFQTGYVTIKDVDEGLYSFIYPNQEVKTAFLENLFYSYTNKTKESQRFILLSKFLYKEDFDSFFNTITAIFASIPYHLESKRDEAYYHTLFYLMVCGSGINAQSEIADCTGRIDLLITFSDKIFIIEFKCNQNAHLALKQIREKGYDRKFQDSGKKIMLVGINFDTEKRNISEWKVEKNI